MSTAQQDTLGYLISDLHQPPENPASIEELKKFVRSMRDELEVLFLERAAIGKRLTVLRQTIAGLADLFGPGVIDRELEDLMHDSHRRPHHRQAGLTDSCRRLLRATSQPLTIQQIFRRLQEEHPLMLTHHKRPTTSLRNVLNRLVAYGEAAQEATEEGIIAWKAVSPQVAQAVFRE
jgi:DNA-binding CsgD family transcriptional regulator